MTGTGGRSGVEMERGKGPSPAYRPEIDGLRAVAVLSVLFFHLGLPGVSAGFTGVDVFFVISGFLITSILMQDLALNRFSLMRFYRRRALRILPPLILVLGVTLLFGFAILLPGELRETGRAALASLFFLSNVFFWSRVDYFTPDAKENPLLHTWSLGIEEQFYLIVPLILWGLWRWFRPALVPVFALSVVLSFALSVWAVQGHATAAFYLLPARYWEMGAGALLAMLLPRLAPVLARAPLWAEGLGSAGALAIAAGLFLLSPASAFPGANALWPVLGAAAVIAAGGTTWAGRFLSLPPMLFLGRISYSLYLWHWPLIVLWKLRMGPVLSMGEQVALGAVAVALATLSTRLVEAPFRHLPARISDARVLAVSALALGVTAGAAYLATDHPERWRSYPPAALDLARYDDFHADPGFIAWNRRHFCFLSADTAGGFAAYGKTSCLAHPPGKPVLLMLGDSLSAHLWHALYNALPEMAVVQANASACRPYPGQSAYPACHDLMRFIFDDWVPREKPQVVVLSARWGAGEEARAADAVQRLRAAGVGRVVVLGPTVEYKGALSKLLARDALYGGDGAAKAVDPARWTVNAALKTAVTAAGADYIDLLALICPDRQCRTWVPETTAGSQPVPMSFDYGHYTPEGAAHVARLLAPQLRPGAAQ